MAAPWASLLVPTPLLTRGQPHGTPRPTALPRILSQSMGAPSQCRSSSTKELSTPTCSRDEAP